MKQRSLVLFSVFFSLLFAVSSCGKKSGGGGGTTPPPPTPEEATLAVTLNPANGSLQAPALPPFNLTVSITSTMPANGVKIEVTAKKDDGSGGAAFYSTSVNSTSATNNFTITGATTGVLNLVEVKVTSLTKATNVWTGSYRFTSK